MKTIAIAIRSHNDVQFAEATLRAIFSQSLRPETVCIFDNASADGTLEVVKKFASTQVFDIPQGEYVAGRVLNFAAKKCQADIVVFNNMDSIPQNNKWLENLVSPIISGEAQVCYARQIARRDAFLWVKRDYQKAFPKDIACSKDFFSMASSAVDSKVLKKISFDESLMYSEDVMFAKTVRESGFKVYYTSNAIAEHSHNYNYSAIRKRFYGEGKADVKIFGSKYSFLQTTKRFLLDVFCDAIFAIKHGNFKEFLSSVKARYIQKKSYYEGRNGIDL